MNYIVSVPCKGVRDGEVYPASFKKGDLVTGDLGEALYNAGKAEKEKVKRGSKSNDRAAGGAGDAGAGKKTATVGRKRKPRKSSG